MIDQTENKRINSELQKVYKEQEEAFLDLWEASRKETDPKPRPFGVNVFGIIDPQRYDTDNGVLFIGKELNGWKDEDLREGCVFLTWMRDIAQTGVFPKGATPNMWYHIGRWAMLLSEPEAELSALASCKASALQQIGTIAFTNVNKVWGKNHVDKAFYKLAEDERALSLLRREIEILRPKTIVCCGTGWLVERVVPDYSGRLITMPHPGARKSTLGMLAQLREQLK